MNTADISLKIFGLIIIYFALVVPLLTWFYLDKKYPKIKDNFIYNTTGGFFTKFKVNHRFFGYITLFVFNDFSKKNNRNRLSHYFETNTDISDLVKIGKNEKYFGIFHIFLVFIFLVDLAIFYILSKGWPINYLYGIERGPTTLQMYRFSGLAVTLFGATIYYSYKFIKKRK